MERIPYVALLLERQCSSSELSLTSTVERTPLQSEKQSLSVGCNLSCRPLLWPILQGEKYKNDLQSWFMEEVQTEDRPIHRQKGIEEDASPEYVTQFLANVHTKNPVLDNKTMLLYARSIAENGLAWDGPSCLVVRLSSFLRAAVWLSDSIISLWLRHLGYSLYHSEE